MPDMHHGGCQCGVVRYRFPGPPLTLYLCHCTECQKQSASAFGMSLWVTRAKLEILSGEPKLWRRGADSGGTVVCAFCPDCGSRLFHAGSPDSETVSLKAGSLDDRAWLKPAAHIWTRSAQPWVDLGGVPPQHVHETEPPSDDALIAAYEEQQRTT